MISTPQTRRFEGRSVILTGAAGRLGRAIAHRFAVEGAKLVLLDRDAGALQALHEDLTALTGGVGACEYPLDLTDLKAVEEAVSSVFDNGGCDILINCAGAYRTGTLVDAPPEKWREALSLNLDTVVNVTRAIARRWIDAGTTGAIVNLTSAASLYPRAGTIGYATAKTALNGLTSVLAMELGPYGIRVNGIAPGMILGEVFSRDTPLDDGEIKLVLSSTPLGRTGRPEDVAAAATFLASDEAAWITGAILPVTGGAHFGRPHYPAAG